jgi:hypothetical protein
MRQVNLSGPAAGFAAPSATAGVGRFGNTEDTIVARLFREVRVWRIYDGRYVRRSIAQRMR